MRPTQHSTAAGLPGIGRSRHMRRASAAIVTAASVALTACGSSSGTPHGVAANAITVRATDHGYAVSGSLRPGTATITFTNNGSVTHSMNAVRIKPGVTQAQVLSAISKGGNPDTEITGLADPPPGPATDYGTPGMAGPGQSLTITVLGLPAGTYVVADFLAAADSQPYVTKGLIGEFEVNGAPNRATPTARGTIRLEDSSIAFPNNFDGTGTWQITNGGTHENSLAIAQLDPSTLLASYFRYVSQRLNHQPIDGGGGTLAGTTTDLRPAQSAFITFHLHPGNYGYLEPPHGPTNGPPPNGTFVIR
jgi:plastocyanin